MSEKRWWDQGLDRRLIDLECEDIYKQSLNKLDPRRNLRYEDEIDE